MSDESQAVKLNLTQWLLEEEKRTEDTLNQMRHVRGTFNTERNVTFGFFEGYLSAIKMIMRREDS